MQKRLYRQRTQETLAVEKETANCDSDFKEIAAAVKCGEEDKTVERLRRQVQEYEKLVQQLKRQLQQLEPGQGSGVDNRQRCPSNYPRKQLGAVCWNCGERGRLKRNCPLGKKSSVDSAAVSSTLMIKGSIEGRVTDILVDTGSAVTLVREDVWIEAKSGGACQLEAPVHMVVAANGGKLHVKITGQCTLQITVGPFSKDHVVLVAKNLHQECLLGADFLMRHGCVLDLQQKIMFTEQGPVHFVSSVCTEHNTPVCFVALSEKVTVPPVRCVCL